MRLGRFRIRAAINSSVNASGRLAAIGRYLNKRGLGNSPPGMQLRHDSGRVPPGGAGATWLCLSVRGVLSRTNKGIRLI